MSHEQVEPLTGGHHIKLIVFLAFVAILGFIIYTSFYGDLPFTGKIVGGFGKSPGTIKINADISVPELNLNGDFLKVEINGGSNSNLFAGGEKFFLGNSRDNYMTMNNYSGKISLNDKKITELKGDTPSLTINGVKIEPKSKNSINVYIDKGFDYNSMSIGEGVLISRISYNATGKIDINDGKNVFNLENQGVVIKSFNGGIKIENRRIILEGYIEGIEITGEQQISISQ